MKYKNEESGLLLFEGTILSYAVLTNDARSGVFVETFEVFKQFLKRNTNMLVMCDRLGGKPQLFFYNGQFSVYNITL